MADTISVNKKSTAFLLRLVISLLYISMGLQGLISKGGGEGIGSLYKAMDAEGLIYLLAVIVLLSGIVLIIPLFSKKLPQSFVKGGMIAVLVIWVAVIFFADIAPGFSNFDFSDWISWIQAVMYHLIVLFATYEVCKKGLE